MAKKDNQGSSNENVSIQHEPQYEEKEAARRKTKGTGIPGRETL